MTRLLILFGSTDGHTIKVAEFLGTELRLLGARVDVFDAGGASPNPEEYDGVIVAASVHMGGYQRCVIDWVRKHALQLHLKPNAFVSVCLGVLQGDDKTRHDLEVIRDRFMARTGWIPADIKVVAGALPYTRYGWLKRMVMRHIVKRGGGPTDTSRDYEFTDWADLRVFARTFQALVTPPVPMPPGVPRRSESRPVIALSGA